MNDYRYYLAVTNNSDVYILEEIYTSADAPNEVLYLTAHEPFHTDTPEGLKKLRAYFNERGWKLGSPIMWTNDHYSCEITF